MHAAFKAEGKIPIKQALYISVTVYILFTYQNAAILMVRTPAEALWSELGGGAVVSPVITQVNSSKRRLLRSFDNKEFYPISAKDKWCGKYKVMYF